MKLLLVAAVLAMTNCGSISMKDEEFAAWKLKFEKSYLSPSEESQRKQIWLSNYEIVLKHNILADQGLKSYHLTMSFFADMENEEYQNLIHCYPRSFNASLPQNGRASVQLPQGTKLPGTVDWRKHGYVTDVKDQKQCGSCWAFSSTGSLEGQNFRKTGKLVSLSEQQLVDCSSSFGNSGCNGGLMTNAFQYVNASGGIDTEASYPYEAKDGSCRYNPNSIGTKCIGYVDVDQGNEEALKQAVATVGPVSVAIDASQDSFHLYKSGVYDEPRCSSTKLDHAVLVVGYGTENGLDYWLVKNSWGIHWGEQGYIKMSRNKNNQCGIATTASYPLVSRGGKKLSCIFFPVPA
ncbi:procathepsin L-like [Pelmatolapia mariae]|uniref:procathepsin L-like n=1 Tax=Pelmatolapia mariae TaxID=158779 RepID=UPI002FE60DBA